MNSQSRVQRIPALGLVEYPLPVIALAGLALGGALTWGLGLGPDGSLVWLGTLVVAGLPVVYSTIRGMLRGRFAADIVAMLAIVFAILLNEAFAGVIIVLMQTGGEALEDYGFGRASSALDALVARAPRTATRKTGDSVVVVPVEEVRPGDLLVVKKGDLIPVDGEVSSDSAEVDESALTGEPLPRTKVEGEKLMSGSVNVGVAFEMKALALSGESQYARIVELVREAEKEKPRVQRLADRYAVWFTPLTICVGLVGVALTGAPSTFLSVLVVATPCPLILATPIAVISGVNRATSRGVIVKSGAALEQAAETRVVVFDKTGTITYGVPYVERVVPLDEMSEDELLMKAAAVEQLSAHPIAASLAAKGRERFGALTAPSKFAEAPSRGVEGEVNGSDVVVGSQRFCEEKMGSAFPERFRAVEKDFAGEGKLVTFVAIDGRPAGIVVFSDEVRPGVPYMLGKLRELGVSHVAMLTGDNQDNAELVARQAGISSFEANLLPAQKVDEVGRLRSEYGVTMMVGDGINDAPALAAATVGVAMGAKGTGISAEAADMVLLVDDVTRVVDAVETGKRMSRVAKQGIRFGLGSSLLLMAIASLGFVPPATGALLQEAIDVSVILNALRVR